MASIKPIMVVPSMSAMVPRPNVQITEKQVKNKPAAAVFGEVNKTAQITIHAIAQEQIVVYA
jgi:hypothetical protein